MQLLFFSCFLSVDFVAVKPKIEGWEGSTLQKIVAKCHKTGALFCYSASGLWWGKLQIRVGKSGLKRNYKTDNFKTQIKLGFHLENRKIPE